MKIIKAILIVCVLALYSCKDKTCTAAYYTIFKMDSNQLINVDVNYIGPSEHKEAFNFGNTQNVKSYHEILHAETYCDTRDFKKNGYNFLTLINNGTEEVYLCVYLSEEVEIIKPNNTKKDVYSLLQVYAKQDKNPNYDYKKEYKNLKYIDRYKLYEQLIKEGYPNIIKLKPKEKYLMKWGNLGFQRIK